jgi:hypothetical protein
VSAQRRRQVSVTLKMAVGLWSTKKREVLTSPPSRFLTRSRTPHHSHHHRCQFLTLSLDFTLDLKMWSDGEAVYARSTAWAAEDLARALGQEFVDTFSLEMEGRLAVEERTTSVRSIAIK